MVILGYLFAFEKNISGEIEENFEKLDYLIFWDGY
jgi:hypothetical protein